MSPTTESRVTRLLPFACLAGAIVLFASELMTTFEFTPPGGEPIDSQSAADRHGNALALIAVFAIGALAIAVFAASKPAATAVAISGVIALLVFLLADLPDANAIGTLDDARQSFFDAEAVPQEGFWLEMLGAVALAVSGVALATLTPEQLASLRPGGRRPETDEAPSAATPATPANGGATAPVNAQPHEAARDVAEEPTHRGARRRPQSPSGGRRGA